ncbi:MAG: Imm53 family immunity protein [Acidimicrobiales bacterium]
MDPRRQSDPLSDPLRFLEAWYEAHCIKELPDGGGVSIEAVDGPGWWMKIDLRGTPLEGCTIKPTVVAESRERWQQSWADGTFFTVATSALDLYDGFVEFRRFVQCYDETFWDQLLTG